MHFRGLLSGTSHCAQPDKPEEFRAVVVAFLSSYDADHDLADTVEGVLAGAGGNLDG